MTTANCGAHDELDFKLVFGEDGAPAPPPPGSRPAGELLHVHIDVQQTAL
ncbi:hypothetical protein FD755_004833 [Muntiacus reevesi]|uniref:Uncharacterized protein n=2 Tax=Muntiacus TaxID=9885 RepID=A0A5J5MTY4_MUNRE|nr:hypothetical protein FD754_016262 [Muntiacus muntjak]KAB0382916.1 hypothetical protein FD755_004833 [Muntiacus reevesi]